MYLPEPAVHLVLAGLGDLLATAPDDFDHISSRSRERRAAEHEEPCMPAPAGRRQPDPDTPTGRCASSPGAMSAPATTAEPSTATTATSKSSRTEHEVIAAGPRPPARSAG